MKTLKEILEGIEIIQSAGDLNIHLSGVQFDSRKVKPGDLFVAVKGTHTDGHQFIAKAIEQGAVAIVCEILPEAIPSRVVFAQIAQTQLNFGKIASAWFDHPSDNLKVVAVTGTNGKTTIATLLYKTFSMLGYKAGLISTIKYYVGNESSPASHTTPDALQIQELMARMVECGCDYCFMEASSHAIDQDRISGIKFDGGIFTNLTHDHLDYHHTFAEYLKAKKKFFDQLPAHAFALTNLDDKNGMVMLQNTNALKQTYSLRSLANFHCKILEKHFDGMLLSIDGREVWTHFTGVFNASNLMAVFGATVLLGIDKEEMLRILSDLHPVAGRFEIIRSPEGKYAVVDYAHTPDAIQNVLSGINEIRKGNEQIITVVGAGGDRDKTKRPEMAAEAVKRSDKVILTSDNPRSEEPEQILADMEAGIGPQEKSKVLSIVNRKEAIRTACMLAKPGDIILVAGKGHEDYQEIKGVKHHFDDKEVINEIFGNI
jgi:UDP-N-acetylmuramoyl-L-alanyl-D-glutamate--2,6-diaminopimelate ligase